MDQALLILDLDETVVWATEEEPGDRELSDVIPFLQWLKDQDDFRKIEKRG